MRTFHLIRNKAMNYDKYPHISRAELHQLYKAILKPRMIEEKMLKLLRQGQVSKWFSGIGQEAIAVGATLALETDEYIMPLHRNLGVFTSRGIPFKKLLHQWQGNAEGFTTVSYTHLTLPTIFRV